MVPAVLANHPAWPWPLAVTLPLGVAFSDHTILVNTGRVPMECAKRYAPITRGGDISLFPLPIPQWCAEAFETATIVNMIVFGAVGVVIWAIWYFRIAPRLP